MEPILGTWWAAGERRRDSASPESRRPARRAGQSGVTITASRDLTGEAEIRALLLRFRRAARSESGRITIDLSGVEIADMKIVAALVDAYQTARRTMIALQIVPSEAVRRVVHLCRLDPMLEQLKPTD